MHHNCMNGFVKSGGGGGFVATTILLSEFQTGIFHFSDALKAQNVQLKRDDNLAVVSALLHECITSGGSRAPTLVGGAPTYNFAKNCMKLKEFGPRGGATHPSRPP